MPTILGNRNGVGNRTGSQRFSPVTNVTAAAKGIGVGQLRRRATTAATLGNRAPGTGNRAGSQRITPPTNITAAAKGCGVGRTATPVSVGGGTVILPTLITAAAKGVGVGGSVHNKVANVTAAAKGIGKARARIAPYMLLGPLKMIAQETGVLSPYTPTNFGVIKRVNQTEQLGDVFAADQGRQWETGDGRVLCMWGDAYGGYWTGPFNGQQDVSHLASLSGSHPAVNAVNYDGTATINVIGGGTAFAASGYITVATNGSQWGGYATFSYTSRDATHFFGCKWQNGNGSFLTGGNQVSSGDPRVGSFFRHNVFAYSSDTDLKDGYTLDSYIETSSGSKVAKEVISYSPAASNNVNSDWVRAYPDAGVAIADIRQAAYGFVVTTQTPHGITADNPYVFLTGLDDTKTTTVAAAKAGFPVSGFTGVDFEINGGGNAFSNISGSLIYVRTVGGNPTDGGFAILSYTGRSPGKFTGVVLVSGSGTLASGETVRQGLFDVGDSLMTGMPQEATEKDWLVKIISLPDPTHQVYIETGLDAVIGVGLPNQGFLKKARNPYTADPTTAPVISVGPSGGAGFAAATPSGCRQVAAFQRFLYVGWHTSYLSGTSIAFSDDVGATWTESLDALWTSGAVFNEPTPQFPVVIGNFVYMFTGPSDRGSTCLMRAPLASALTKSAWRYWDGEDWNTDFDSMVGLWTGSMSEAPYVVYHQGQKVYIATYVDASNQVWVRFASRPEGPWSTPQMIASSGSFVPADLPYAPKIHPYSGRFTNDPAVLFFTITLYNAYNTFLMSTLIGPLDVAVAAKAVGVGKASTSKAFAGSGRARTVSKASGAGHVSVHVASGRGRTVAKATGKGSHGLGAPGRGVTVSKAYGAGHVLVVHKASGRGSTVSRAGGRGTLLRKASGRGRTITRAIGKTTVYRKASGRGRSTVKSFGYGRIPGPNEAKPATTHRTRTKSKSNRTKTRKT